MAEVGIILGRVVYFQVPSAGVNFFRGAQIVKNNFRWIFNYLF